MGEAVAHRPRRRERAGLTDDREAVEEPVVAPLILNTLLERQIAERQHADFRGRQVELFRRAVANAHGERVPVGEDDAVAVSGETDEVIEGHVVGPGSRQEIASLRHEAGPGDGADLLEADPRFRQGDAIAIVVALDHVLQDLVFDLNTVDLTEQGNPNSPPGRTFDLDPKRRRHRADVLGGDGANRAAAEIVQRAGGDFPTGILVEGGDDLSRDPKLDAIPLALDPTAGDLGGVGRSRGRAPLVTIDPVAEGRDVPGEQPQVTFSAEAHGLARRLLSRGHVAYHVGSGIGDRNIGEIGSRETQRVEDHDTVLVRRREQAGDPGRRRRFRLRYRVIEGPGPAFLVFDQRLEKRVGDPAPAVLEVLKIVDERRLEPLLDRRPERLVPPMGDRRERFRGPQPFDRPSHLGGAPGQRGGPEVPVVPPAAAQHRQAVGVLLQHLEEIDAVGDDHPVAAPMRSVPFAGEVGKGGGPVFDLVLPGAEQSGQRDAGLAAAGPFDRLFDSRGGEVFAGLGIASPVVAAEQLVPLHQQRLAVRPLPAKQLGLAVAKRRLGRASADPLPAVAGAAARPQAGQPPGTGLVLDVLRHPERHPVAALDPARVVAGADRRLGGQRAVEGDERVERHGDVPRLDRLDQPQELFRRPVFLVVVEIPPAIRREPRLPLGRPLGGRVDLVEIVVDLRQHRPIVRLGRRVPAVVGVVVVHQVDVVGGHGARREGRANQGREQPRRYPINDRPSAQSLLRQMKNQEPSSLRGDAAAPSHRSV